MGERFEPYEKSFRFPLSLFSLSYCFHMLSIKLPHISAFLLSLPSTILIKVTHLFCIITTDLVPYKSGRSNSNMHKIIKTLIQIPKHKNNLFCMFEISRNKYYMNNCAIYIYIYNPLNYVRKYTVCLNMEGKLNIINNITME